MKRGSLCVPSRSWHTDEDAALRTLWDAGESSTAIGKVLGRTKNAICNRARKLKLSSRFREKAVPYTAHELGRLRRTPHVALVHPNAKNYFDAHAALWRLLERMGAA